MAIPKSLVSIQKEGDDKVSWHLIDKNIYDEDVDIVYTFRVLGIPLFKFSKKITTRHDFSKERDINKIAGFGSGKK